MRWPRATRVVGIISIALALSMLAGCSGTDETAPTTFTVPPITSPLTTSSLPSTTTTTKPAPRADQVGLSPGFNLSLSTADLDTALDALAATRVRWLRVDFDWSVIQAGGPTSFDWSYTDRIVDAARARNLSIIA